MESCRNCETKIGKLETGYIWNDTIVCKDCHSRLEGSSSRPKPVLGRCCPACKSAHVASLNMVHQSGTSTGTLSGLSLNSEGTVGGFGGKTASQSTLAAAAAPPLPKNDVMALAVFLSLASAILLFGWIQGGGGVLLSLAIVCVALTITCQTMAIRSRRWNRDDYPGLLHRWRLTWMCLQCGTRFVPDTPAES